MARRPGQEGSARIVSARDFIGLALTKGQSLRLADLGSRALKPIADTVPAIAERFAIDLVGEYNGRPVINPSDSLTLLQSREHER